MYPSRQPPVRNASVQFATLDKLQIAGYDSQRPALGAHWLLRGPVDGFEHVTRLNYKANVMQDIIAGHDKHVQNGIMDR